MPRQARQCGTDAALEEVVYTRGKGSASENLHERRAGPTETDKPGGAGGSSPRRRATLAVDTNQRLREVTGRAQLPAELLSVPVQAHVVTVLREPQAKTPEGRSAVLQDIGDLLEDAVFAASRRPGLKFLRNHLGARQKRILLIGWVHVLALRVGGAWDLELKSE